MVRYVVRIMVDPSTVTVDVGAMDGAVAEILVCIVEASVSLFGIATTCALLGAVCTDPSGQARFQGYGVEAGLSGSMCACVLRDRQSTIIALAALHSPQSTTASTIASVYVFTTEGRND